MKKLACSFIALFVFGLVCEPAAAQRRRRPRPCPPATSGGSIQEVAAGTTDEWSLILEGCKTGDRPKPAADVTVVAGLGGKAVSKPTPSYPREAKEAKVYGSVKVEIVTDEKGRVVWAQAVTGHPLLQDAAVKAACQARYSPTLRAGRPVKTRTSITYSFEPQ